MRHLLLLLPLLLATPQARAQEPGGPHGSHARELVVNDAALVPHERPSVVSGEVTTKRFRILHTAGATVAARELAAQIEGIRDGFGNILGRDWPGVTEIRLGKDRAEFEALALPGGRPPSWAVALAYPAHQIILLNARSLHEPDGQQTLRHELAHVALGQLAKDWPRWFQEGVAQNVTGERYSLTHYSALFRAVTQERVFTFEDLEDDWPDHPADVEVAYAQSAAFIAHLSGKFGPEAMGLLVDGVRNGEPFEQAFGKAFRISLSLEEKDWREGLAARYGWLPLTTSSALLWLVASALCVAAYVRRRQQKEARLAEMAAQDVAEDAALRVLAAQASALPGTLPGSEVTGPVPELAWPEWPAATASANEPDSLEPRESQDAPGRAHEAPSHADEPREALSEESPVDPPAEAEDLGDPRGPRSPKPTLH
ncbi:peptidase MA family metallohydrolase [Pyxidicoccus trucidator]|uniref:peptidase MA family metallohydrolase n=1 Tax=Pyxidicoccus trucidator TaxID=2709662 RepID=UPI0013DA28F2|nr:peptidase MA family metallohydrolase [Pyxidicoccus trucidator]